MNIFQGLLFLHGHISNAALASSLARSGVETTPEEDYGQTYGNRIANEKHFREPWDQRRRDPSLQPIQHPNACVGGCG